MSRREDCERLGTGYGPNTTKNQVDDERQSSGLGLEEAIKTIINTQSMIDIAAKHLYGLRDSDTSEELIQKEICESENKLIRLFSKILAVKARLYSSGVDGLPAELSDYPSTYQWLGIVGINETVAQRLREKHTLKSMLEMRSRDLVQDMTKLHANCEDVKRLTTALANLKLATENQLNGWKAPDVKLHWSTGRQSSGGIKSTSSSPYGGASPKFVHTQRGTSISSLPGDAILSVHSPQSPAPYHPYGIATGDSAGGGGRNEDSSSSSQTSPFTYYPSPATERRRGLTPPATPPVIKAMNQSSTAAGSSSGKGGKFPTTPPPQKKHKLYPDQAFQPLTKSKSHESQLANKIVQNDVDITKYIKKKPTNLTLGSSEAIMQHKRSVGDLDDVSMSKAPLSGQSSPLLHSPFRSPFRITADSHNDAIAPYKSKLAVIKY